MFKLIQDHISCLGGGVLQLDGTTVYNTDNDTLLAQLDTIVELVRQKISSIGLAHVSNQPSEDSALEQQEVLDATEENGEEYEEEDDEEDGEEDDEEGPAKLVTNDPEEQKNIEMLLQMRDAETSSSEGDELVQRPLSEYEKKKQRLYEQIKKIEDELVKEKSWRMQGEVTANMREQDEIVKDMPEFQLKRRQKVVMDEQLMRSIEEVVKQRILDKNYDNVVFERKKEVKELKDIDTDKDSKGLDQILTEQKIGERVQLTELQQKQQKKCLEAYGLLETELRSYFVNGTFNK